MHDQHVGITPELAAELARLLLDPAAQGHAAGAWGAVCERLVEELSTFERYRFGLLLGAHPCYSVVRLALPIVEAACRQVRRCHLFCEDEIKTAVRRSDYVAHAKALARSIIQMAHKENGPFQLFWKERAITLAGFSRRPVTSDKDAALPEVDPAALGLLLRLEPDMPPSEQPSQRLRPLTTSPQRQKSRQQNEDGLDGVYVTRRLAELDRMLLSEFVYPPAVLADRIVHSGYLATRRQPKRERLRDVLVAAIMPGEMHTKLNADFVKACWFDSVMRLSLMLRQNRLHQSEFRWIEGDSFDRVRTCTFPLQNMPTFTTAPESRPDEMYRQAFMTALRWLPPYLNLYDHFEGLAGYAAQADLASDNLERLRRWCCAAWTAKGRPKTDDYAFVHVMLFLPTRERTNTPVSGAARLGRLRGGLGLGPYPERHVSVTWVPETVQDLAGWSFDAWGRLESPLFRGGPAGITGQELAGRLGRAWLDQWIKEIGRV
jgi:hypothetical protein